MLDAQTLPAHVVHWHEDVRGRARRPAEAWRIREVGDGNLNLVFLVDGPRGSVCIKQALPYVRVAGPWLADVSGARILRERLFPQRRTSRRRASIPRHPPL